LSRERGAVLLFAQHATAWRWKSLLKLVEVKSLRSARLSSQGAVQDRSSMARKGTAATTGAGFILTRNSQFHTIEQAQTARKKRPVSGGYEGLVRSLLAIFNPYCTVSSQRIGNQALGSMRHDQASCRAPLLVGEFPIHRRLGHRYKSFAPSRIYSSRSRTSSTGTGCRRRGDTAPREPSQTFPVASGSDPRQPASNLYNGL
jgi:hypothetical protein